MSSQSPWLRAETLVSSAQRGDRSAIENLIRITQHDLRRFVASLAGAEEADDLTQETYLRALKSLPAFRRESSVRTWLLTLARRTVVDHFRLAGRRPQLSDTDWTTAADAGDLRTGRALAADPSTAAGWQDLLVRLRADRREALLLTQVLGLSYDEAAEVCGCPVGTIRSRVARGRDDLLSLVHDGDDPGLRQAQAR